MIDSLAYRADEKKRIKHIKKTSPDQGVVQVRINAKTVIFIRKGQDPEERKAAYLHRLFVQEQKDKRGR